MFKKALKNSAINFAKGIAITIAVFLFSQIIFYIALKYQLTPESIWSYIVMPSSAVIFIVLLGTAWHTVEPLAEYIVLYIRSRVRLYNNKIK